MGLATKAVRGAAWSIGSSLGARAVGIVGTLLITRFLDPAVMGEVTAASILVLTANYLSNLGVGNYAIARYNEGPDVTFACTVVYMLAGVVALGAALLWGADFGPMFNAPTMGQYIPGLVLAIFIRRIGHMPDKVLARELRFRSIGLALALGELAYAVSSVAMAYYKWGGMAMVWGNVIQACVSTGIVVVSVNWREWLAPHRVTWARVKDALDFGLPVGLVGTAHYVSVTWDNLLYSRYFGVYQMSFYNLGYNLAAVPATQIGEQAGVVLFPSMSKVDSEAKRRVVVRSTGLMGLLVFPLALGLMAVSESLIKSILLPPWWGVAPVLSALAAVTVVRPLTWAASSYLLSEGYTRSLALIEMVKLLGVAGGIMLFAPYGPVWACAGVGVGFLLQFVFYAIPLRDHGVSMTGLWRAFYRPLLACAPMLAAVYATRWGVSAVWTDFPPVTFVCEVLVGVIVFIPSAFLFCGDIARDFLGLIKSALKRAG